MEIIGLLWNGIIVRPMTNSLVLTYAVFFSNFGLAIIVFTVILRVATFPLTLRQTRVMKRMSQLQPKLKEVQQKYAGDRAKISQETMKMYREHGINPLGCLGPMVLQFPIFIGMFYAIRDTLPTFPHALAGLGPKLYSQLPLVDAAVPVNSSFLWLNLGVPDKNLLLPILVGLSTWLSMRTTTLPSADPRQASTNRMMQWMMPAMLGFITLSFPSGLALYWIVSNLVGMVIQYSVTGRAGLFPSRGMVPVPAPQPAKELVKNGDQRQLGDERQNRGRGHRAGFKGARHKSRGGRGKRY